MRWPSLATTIDNTCIRRGAKVSGGLHTDDGAAQGHVAPKVNITSDSQMVELENLRDLLEPLLELGNLQKQKNLLS